MIDLHEDLLSSISARRIEMTEFLQNLIRIPSPNPPGDTQSAMKLIEGFLSERGIPFEIVAPDPRMPNLIAQFDGGQPGPRLVMNGHLDVFPEGDASKWNYDPWGAIEKDGCIFGRGACDMKSGTTALLFAFAELYERRSNLHGSLVLTVVSDEETGSNLGARYLLENRKDVHGDCLLNSEPTSPFALRFGEKGPLWLRCKVNTPGAHGAYVHMSKNAIQIAATVISGLYELQNFKSPEGSSLVLALQNNARAVDRAYGTGASAVISGTTVNVGTIQAGVSVNMLPSECTFEVDIRIPPGVSHSTVIDHIDSVIAPYPEVTYEITNQHDANASEPDHPMVQSLIRNAVRVSGVEPAPIIGLGATDARLWRHAGIPAFIYGPSPTGMGKADEFVRIDEFVHIAKTHALAALDYLSG